MATEPIVVIGPGYTGGKTVADQLGNTEHRQKVLADMEANGMGDMAQQLATSYGITYTPKANTETSATTSTTPPTDTSTNTNTNGGVDINGAINDSQKLIDKQIETLNNYESTMTKLYQDSTDFEVKKIEQQKAEAKKDLEKEQTAAYVDYQKEINPYGANAEQLASQGMGGTGYAESSRVKMYSAYQNRVAIAKESYNKAVVSYNNAMTEARLQNSIALAQLASDTLTKTLELTLNGLQYRNELLMWQDETNYNRGRDIIEDNRYKEAFDYQKGRDKASDEQWQKDYELRQKEVDNMTYDFTNEESEPEITNPIDLNIIVSTEFYNDTVNPDAQYGVFKTKDINGFAYQPDNIDGDKLEPAGFTTCVASKDRYGKERITKQNVWRCRGDLWVWNGAKNEYEHYEGGRSFIPRQDTTVSTPYYNGRVNSDVRHGTFRTTDVNGARYQPDNVGGEKLEWTGDYHEVEVEQKYGTDRKKKETVEVKIWKTKNGKKKYYWNGNENKYIPFEESEESVPGIRVTNNSSGNTSDPTYWDYSKYSFK